MGRAGGPAGCGRVQKAFNWNRVTARQPSNARDARNPLPASKGRFLYRLIKKRAVVGGNRVHLCLQTAGQERGREGPIWERERGGGEGNAMQGSGRRGRTGTGQHLWDPTASQLLCQAALAWYPPWRCREEAVVRLSSSPCNRIPLPARSQGRHTGQKAPPWSIYWQGLILIHRDVS